MSFEERQRFLRLVVDGIVVEDGRIKVETILPPGNEGTLRNVRGEPVEPRVHGLGILHSREHSRIGRAVQRAFRNTL